MSERPLRPVFVPYELRPEYDVRRVAQEYNKTVAILEDAMELHAVEAGSISYNGQLGVVHRELELFYASDTPVEERNEVSLTMEEFRKGPLRQLACVTLKECIGRATAPFITEYHLEAFEGGGIQAQVSSTDVIHNQGLEVRTMTPYDFRNLSHQIESATDLLERASISRRV